MKYRRVSRVNLYNIEEFEGYYYGYMVPDTSYLNYFKLYPYDGGIVMQTSRPRATRRRFRPSCRERRFISARRKPPAGVRSCGVDTVGDLNDRIVDGSVHELILVQEALMEQKMGEIASKIAADRKKKFVMIAGPSSSGKTTFSHRLSIQLRTLGLKPHPIAVDNYFVDREKTPGRGRRIQL